jgi:acyl-CoA synthetase (AMP-forming)/AMP-acid ligase II
VITAPGNDSSMGNGAERMAQDGLPSGVVERTVPDLLERNAREYPQRNSLIAHSTYLGEEIISYAELRDRSRRLASVLLAHGVGRGDRVAILSGNDGMVDAITAYHASHVVGAINVPLNGRYVERELGYVINFVQPRAIVFTPEFAGILRSVLDERQRDVLLLETGSEELLGKDLRALAQNAPAAARVMLDEHDDADWIFTSGTTGNPKAVAITHGSSVACGHQAARLWGLDDDSVYSSSAPFFTSTGCHTNQLAVLVAGCTYLCEREFDTQATIENISRHGVTSIFVISGMLHLIIQRHGRDALVAMNLSPLRRLCYGGQSMPADFYHEVDDIFRRHHDLELVHLYGLTEGGTSGLMVPPEQHAEAVSLAGKYGMAIGSQGFNDWIDFKVAAGDGSSAPDGEVGEICLRAPSLMDRYVNEPAATAAALRDGWLHTGDMATRIGGYVYFVDRSKQMIRRGGLNISSAEVESVIVGCRGVQEAAVVAVPNPVLGEEVGAFVVCCENGLTAEAVIDHCRRNLADYKVPVRIEFLSTLPRNGMGRVVKHELSFLE